MNEVYFIIGALVILFFIYPYARFFLKRLSLMVRIKLACKKRGYILHKNRPLWFLGRIQETNCDFHIETPDRVYSVKLGGFENRKAIVNILDEKHYVYHSYRYVVFMLNPSSQKGYTFPDYRFDFGRKDSFLVKEPYRVLLMHPLTNMFSFEPGNFVSSPKGGLFMGDFVIYSGFEFVRLLKND